MAEQVTKIAFFTIADFKEEEVWLRERACEGLHLARMVAPCFYIFEKGAPEDVIYRLDFPDNGEDRDYARMLTDFGWENCGRCMGWVYWRRRAAETENEGERELFTDDVGRLDMVKNIVRTRMLPLLLLFFACVLPNLFRALSLSLHPLRRQAAPHAARAGAEGITVSLHSRSGLVARSGFLLFPFEDV